MGRDLAQASVHLGVEETALAFTVDLRDSLRERTSRVPVEFAGGESLEAVLSRHLLAVESLSDSVLLTSILLLDSDGKRLRHAAAPSLPQSYCAAIDGSEIGPVAGSCGTAAYHGHAIYVTDIATDALWAGYRDIALPHGLRACWSTPIHDDEGKILGTFAVYHLTPRGPTKEEVAAIGMITHHVSQAIQWSQSREPAEPIKPDENVIALEFGDRGPERWPARAKSHIARLESHIADLERYADAAATEGEEREWRSAAETCRKLIAALRSDITRFEGS